MRLSAVGLISIAFAAFSPGAFALDPAMLNLVSPGASSLIGVDMVRVQASPFGQYINKTLSQQVGEIDKIAAATGFDPRRDLQEVLIAANTTSGSASNRGLIIARGVFDQQRLLGMAKTAGLLQTGYKGVTLLTSQQGGTDFEAAAFLAGYLVAGTRSEVEGAIDRSTMRTSANALASRALLASTRYDAWLVTSVPSELANVAGGGNQGIPMRGISSVAGGVQFGSQVEIGVEAEARSVQDATSLADVVRLIAALGQSNQAAAQMGNLLNSLVISTDGNFVRASMKVPQADIERLFNTNPGTRPAARPRARRVAAR